MSRRFSGLLRGRNKVHFVSYVIIPILVALVGYSLFQIFGGIVNDFSLWTERLNFETGGAFPYIPSTLIYFFIIGFGVVFMASYYRAVRRIK